MNEAKMSKDELRRELKRLIYQYGEAIGDLHRARGVKSAQQGDIHFVKDPDKALIELAAGADDAEAELINFINMVIR